MTDSIKEVPKYAQGDTFDLVSRAAVVAMLREERDRAEVISCRFTTEGNETMAHNMRIRANVFEMSAYMVEMMT